MAGTPEALLLIFTIQTFHAKAWGYKLAARVSVPQLRGQNSTDIAGQIPASSSVHPFP